MYLYYVLHIISDMTTKPISEFEIGGFGGFFPFFLCKSFDFENVLNNPFDFSFFNLSKRLLLSCDLSAQN